jgi:hypothetical protein
MSVPSNAAVMSSNCIQSEVLKDELEITEEMKRFVK